MLDISVIYVKRIIIFLSFLLIILESIIKIREGVRSICFYFFREVVKGVLLLFISVMCVIENLRRRLIEIVICMYMI